MRNAQKTLGRFIKRSREVAGFKTIGQLGARTGLNPATLWRIEKGIALPRPETLRRISPAIKVPLKVLMEKAGYLDLEKFNAGEGEVPYGSEILNLSGLSQEDREKLKSYFEFLKYLSGRN